MSHKAVVSGHLDDGENTSQEVNGKQTVLGYFFFLLLNGKAMLLDLVYTVDLCTLEFGINSYSVNHQKNKLFHTAKAEQMHSVIRTYSYF